MVTLGGYIRQARQSAGMEARALAATLGVAAPYVSDIELNRRIPSEAILNGIAAALNVPAADLFAYAGRLDAATRAYLASHPLAMHLLRRIAALDLTEAELQQLLDAIDSAQGGAVCSSESGSTPATGGA